MKKLSICIPSYHRFQALAVTIQSILSAKSSDFDVWIVDNQSPVDIEEAITQRDERLHLVKREATVYGPNNVCSCVAFSDGEFSLLLLDKDTLSGEDLDKFIQYLSTLPSDVQGGYCALDHASSLGENQLVVKNAVLSYGYLNKHPSGEFYRTETAKDILSKMSEKMKDNPFSYDLLLTECAARGAMATYQQPMIKTANINQLPGNEQKSLAFRADDHTLFFHPENRMKNLAVYAEHMQNLPISKDIYKQMLWLVYKRTLVEATFGYRDIMSNSVICEHYHTHARKVDAAEMDMWAEKVQEAFADLNIDEGIKKQLLPKGKRYFYLKKFARKIRRPLSVVKHMIKG